MVRVLATRVFSVIGRDDDDEKIPRIPLRHVSSSRAIDLLRLHGFVIVTSLGTELESRLEKLREAMTSFFALPVDKKEECVGGVYVSERGVPMYRVGFESQERIRECFRIELRNPLYPEGARTEWQRVLGPLRRIADKVLCASLQSPPKTGDDFSIAYSFLYPNSEQYGLLDAPHTLVKEHADPSLVV